MKYILFIYLFLVVGLAGRDSPPLRDPSFLWTSKMNVAQSPQDDTILPLVTLSRHSGTLHPRGAGSLMRCQLGACTSETEPAIVLKDLNK